MIKQSTQINAHQALNISPRRRIVEENKDEVLTDEDEQVAPVEKFAKSQAVVAKRKNMMINKKQFGMVNKVIRLKKQ